jgi:COP9 signalosome complex subunit 1
MGNEDLGNHYLAMGDYVMATKCYTRMREYCTTPKHLAELNLKLLYVAILQTSWTNAQSFRLKMFTVPSKDDEKISPHEAVLNACTGLSLLNLRQYRDAADSFLSIDPIYMTVQPLASINFQRQVLSPNDIAIYGGLCALATMDSNELKTRVLENQNFRQFLELEPHLRRAINMFCNSKFSNCLAVLDSYAADYKLDLYIGSYFNELYMAVRGKSLVKWFSAFSVATLEEVQSAFPPLEDISIENELEAMIKAGILDARIDLVDGVSSTRKHWHSSELT